MNNSKFKISNILSIFFIVIMFICIIGGLILKLLIKENDKYCPNTELIKIDSISKENKKLTIEIDSLDKIKDATIVEVKALDSDSTIKLFYKLIRE